MSPDLLLFLAIAALAIGTALAMLFSRNAIYSALFLVVNFLVVALLYLILGAAFIAMVQVTVYAGAIMVLFLFVVMLLGTARIPGRSPLRWQLPVGIAFGVALVGLTVYALVFREPRLGALPDLPVSFGSPATVGTLLYNEYLIPVEVASILLLVSMVGAIVLTRRRGRQAE
jgi:NADH-quinone oxidoreductase subunit J